MICELIYNAATYPCLFFQIYMTLKELKYRNVAASSEGFAGAGSAGADPTSKLTSSPLGHEVQAHSNNINNNYTNRTSGSGGRGYADERVPIAVAVAYPQSD